jgi:uncharacterized YccA/Bax inhibitor family protein
MGRIKINEIYYYFACCLKSLSVFHLHFIKLTIRFTSFVVVVIIIIIILLLLLIMLNMSASVDYEEMTMLRKGGKRAI